MANESALGFLWKEWCQSWSSSTLATSWEELTHWKRLWCWEGLGAGGEGDNRGWDGCMASRTQWMWVWVNSGSWCWTGMPGVLWFMGSQRVGHNWATELNWLKDTNLKTQWFWFLFDIVFSIRSLCFLLSSFLRCDCRGTLKSSVATHNSSCGVQMCNDTFLC